MRVTEKQKKTLRKLGIETDNQMTANEASYLINAELEALEESDDANYNSFLDDDIPLFDRSIEDDWS